MKFVKWIPNVLSMSRIIMAVSLLFFEPFSAVFIVVYVVAGLTDSIDGPLARRLNAQSKLGNDLDSIGDYLLAAITLWCIVPVMDFNTAAIIIIISVFVGKALAVLTSVIKFKKVISLHTFFSKILAWLVFMFPLLYWVVKYGFPQLYEWGITENELVYVLGGLCILIMLEEMVIHLVSKEPNPHSKGLLFDRKKRA